MSRQSANLLRTKRRLIVSTHWSEPCIAAEFEGLPAAAVLVAVLVAVAVLAGRDVAVVFGSGSLPPSRVGGGPGTTKEPKSELR